ncbi:MAG: hypothetical protein RMK84_05325 [Oscillochloridaceae bacterium]|nr:hypothetical protein [Chloroflexaceae bacterium]MDW8389524.1 hypothetical protein [Oscillochloridaceae bacterium]
MSKPIEDVAQRQRLLEGWLPLAQEANQRYGWELDAPALERLIISAAPALGLARSSFEAYAILWGAYTRLRRDDLNRGP